MDKVLELSEYHIVSAKLEHMMIKHLIIVKTVLYNVYLALIQLRTAYNVLEIEDKE